ncbi:MAG TPA: hypothetical protein VGI74_02700 [Streptosporangiaceae bacterium]
MARFLCSNPNVSPADGVSGEAAIGWALARKIDQTEASKMIVEAVVVAFGAGAAIGWIANTIRTHRLSSQSMSPDADLVVSLLPGEPSPLTEWGELTGAAHLIIILTTDPRGESRR